MNNTFIGTSLEIVGQPVLKKTDTLFYGGATDLADPPFGCRTESPTKPNSSVQFAMADANWLECVLLGRSGRLHKHSHNES
jgi:hypothetical protein